MARYQEQKTPVKSSSFRVNEDSLAKDVILDYKTQLSQVTLNAEDSFNPIIVPSVTITPIESPKNAVPEQLVTIKGKVNSLTGPKKILTRNKAELLKQGGILVDPSGQINIGLWQDKVDSLLEDHT